MSGEETQRRRLTEILEQTSATLDPAEEAAVLYARGVRVLQLDEVILSRSDAKLLDLVRQATERWEERKEETNRPLEPGASREALILAALRNADEPISRSMAIKLASGSTTGGRAWSEWGDAFDVIREKGLLEQDPTGPKVRPRWILREGGTP